MLRSRYGKEQCIPLTEVEAYARIYELPMRRTAEIVLACDEAWFIKDKQSAEEDPERVPNEVEEAA